MGGFGSGRWNRIDRKWTVEESLHVEIRDFRKAIHRHSAGRITWTWTHGIASSVHYHASWNRGPMITLEYVCDDEEKMRIPIQLQLSFPHFGGERFWFCCPLIRDGVQCNRRVGKLFLPPDSRYFGCRHCHNLSYRSSQEAHWADRHDRRIETLERHLEKLGRLHGFLAAPSNL